MLTQIGKRSTSLENIKIAKKKIGTSELLNQLTKADYKCLSSKLTFSLEIKGYKYDTV